MHNTTDAYRRMVERDFPNPEDRRCHVCDREHPLEALAGGNGACIQAFTGRVFCDGCWDDYRKGEGF